MKRCIVFSIAVLFIFCTQSCKPEGNTGGHPISKIYNDVKTGIKELKTDEDNLIRESIVGKVYLDDEYIENRLLKDRRMEFDESGVLSFEGNIEMYIQEIEDNIELSLKIGGNWNVKDKYLYYKYNDASISSTNQLFQTRIEEGYFSKEEMLNELNSKNTPEQVVYFGPDKIVTKDADGKNTVMKKSY
jgi:hypothetical protein